MILRSAGFGSPSSPSMGAASSSASATNAVRSLRDTQFETATRGSQSRAITCELGLERLAGQQPTSFLLSGIVRHGVLAICGSIKQHQIARSAAGTSRCTTAAAPQYPVSCRSQRHQLPRQIHQLRRQHERQVNRIEVEGPIPPRCWDDRRPRH